MTDEARKLFISFSGGETSAYMTLWLMQNKQKDYDEIKVLFANTGQENEQTLEFIDQFSSHFDIPVTWVEALVYHGKRRACGHSIVTYKTASRQGEPFEEVIKKYGIPNQKFPHCTRELKLNPMRSYLRSIGWQAGSYDTAVGIRNDEFDRMAADHKAKRIIYPLISMKPTTKADVNAFWDRQPFRLKLKGYQGNCKWCWKKSFRKHFTLIREDPSIYEFPRRMEELYAEAGAGDVLRTFFRENKSTADLFDMASAIDYEPASDDSEALPIDRFLDFTSGCSDSCEVY